MLFVCISKKYIIKGTRIYLIWQNQNILSFFSPIYVCCSATCYHVYLRPQRCLNIPCEFLRFFTIKTKAPGVHSKHVRCCIFMRLFTSVSQKDLLTSLWCKAFFSGDIHSSVFVLGLIFFSLHRLSFDCSVTLPVIRINLFFGQIVHRQNTHLDTSATPVWQQTNWICSFRFWFSFLPFFPADDTDVLIHHDSTLYPSHLWLFWFFSTREWKKVSQPGVIKAKKTKASVLRTAARHF